MSGRPYCPNGGPHCHVKVRGVFVKTYIPFLKDACDFVPHFRSCRVLVGPHVEEKCTYDQVADGCVQMCVFMLVDVKDYLLWYIFLMFRCWVQRFVAP